MCRQNERECVRNIRNCESFEVESLSTVDRGSTVALSLNTLCLLVAEISMIFAYVYLMSKQKISKANIDVKCT